MAKSSPKHGGYPDPSTTDPVSKKSSVKTPPSKTKTFMKFGSKGLNALMWTGMAYDI